MSKSLIVLWQLMVQWGGIARMRLGAFLPALRKGITLGAIVEFLKGSSTAVAALLVEDPVTAIVLALTITVLAVLLDRAIGGSK